MVEEEHCFEKVVEVEVDRILDPVPLVGVQGALLRLDREKEAEEVQLHGLEVAEVPRICARL